MPDPLSQDELEKLHRLALAADDIERIIDGDKKARWLWAIVRSIALWLTAVIVGITAVKSFILDSLGIKH
jgi:hypothetical protein